MEWLNVQTVFDQLAGPVLADLLNHDGHQERHILCYVGLSSRNQYNSKTLAVKLREALQKHLRTAKDPDTYRELAQSETLINSDEKNLFMEVLCTLLASTIQVYDSTNDCVLMLARPASHINPLRAVPYKVNLKTKNLFKADLFEAVLSSPGSSSDAGSLSACSEDDPPLPSPSKKVKLVANKNKKKVLFVDQDGVAGPSRELLGTWSKQEMSEIVKRKQVLKNVCLFIDKFEDQVERHVTDCLQCPVHCYGMLNKRIKKIPGRPKKHK